METALLVGNQWGLGRHAAWTRMDRYGWHASVLLWMHWCGWHVAAPPLPAVPALVSSRGLGAGLLRGDTSASDRAMWYDDMIVNDSAPCRVLHPADDWRAPAYAILSSKSPSGSHLSVAAAHVPPSRC